MSSAFQSGFRNNNTLPFTQVGSGPTQLINTSTVVEKPCPPPINLISYVYGPPLGWNAVLVGLLSCLLALAFLLTCLYYLAFRRRYAKEGTDAALSQSSVALVDKKGGTSIPVTSSSQTATTTFINEPGKEIKMTTYTEQGAGPTAGGDFVVGIPTVGNGHAASINNGLLANGITDPSELRLLQHEHH
jgi:hypothetical protein